MAGELRAMVDGAPLKPVLQGRYVVFDGLRAGQTAAIGYPLRESARDYHIAGKTYRGAWRGSTMMGISPAGEGYGIYERAGLLAGADPAILVEDALPVPAQPALW